jgi:predicted RNase H-like HicB family nuclease
VPRLRLLAWVASVATLTGIAGCGSSAEEMREAAETLVPPGSRIVAREDGDCVMVADAPSCHTIGFLRPTASLEKRADEVRQAAGQAGWELEEELRAEGATFLEYTRDGLKASVTLWADFRAKPCRLRPRMDCADHVRVVR